MDKAQATKSNNKVIKRPSKTGDLVTTNLQITWKYRN